MSARAKAPAISRRGPEGMVSRRRSKPPLEAPKGGEHAAARRSGSSSTRRLVEDRAEQARRRTSPDRTEEGNRRRCPHETLRSRCYSAWLRPSALHRQPQAAQQRWPCMREESPAARRIGGHARQEEHAQGGYRRSEDRRNSSAARTASTACPLRTEALSVPAEHERQQQQPGARRASSRTRPAGRRSKSENAEHAEPDDEARRRGRC